MPLVYKLVGSNTGNNFLEIIHDIIGEIKLKDMQQYLLSYNIKKEDLKRFLEDAHRRFYFRQSYIFSKALKVRSFREFFDHAKFAYQMFFNVTAYKN